MTAKRALAAAAFVFALLGAVAALLAISNDWNRVEQFLDWFYPLPLLILLAGALGVMTALYVRERRRDHPKTYREVSVEQGEARERKKAEARRTITLILNEVSGNKRALQRSLVESGMGQLMQSENWVAHRHALAEMKDASAVFAVTSEAYDLFEHLNALASRHTMRAPDLADKSEAAATAGRAEAKLKEFLNFIEAPGRRWAIGGDESAD